MNGSIQFTINILHINISNFHRRMDTSIELHVLINGTPSCKLLSEMSFRPVNDNENIVDVPKIESSTIMNLFGDSLSEELHIIIRHGFTSYLMIVLAIIIETIVSHYKSTQSNTRFYLQTADFFQF
jgi:hypothetical protein